MSRPFAPFAAGLLLLLATGCAGPVTTDSQSATAPPAVSESEVQVLRERAAAYWAARMNVDDQAQWELVEPRARGRFTPKEYGAGRQGVRYLGYQVEEAVIEGYFATVKVRLLIQPVMPNLVGVGQQTVRVDDRWVRIQGTWYRVFDTEQGPRR